MWTQLSLFYSCMLFGIYCFVLPKSSALQQKLRFSGSKELKLLASEISNNKNFKNDEFKMLVKPLLTPRMPDTDSHRMVQEYIKAHFRRLEWHLEEDTFHDNTPWGTKKFNNLIFTLDPTVKNKMVLSCHYDSKNMTSGGKSFIAATDSAVPCAIVMDVAKKLDCSLRQQQRTRKRSLADDVTLQIMFFDGEEAYVDWTETDSLYGSRHLAKMLRESDDPYWPGTKRLDNIDIFILLDLIGSADVHFKNYFRSTTPHFQQLQKIEKALKDNNLLNPKGIAADPSRNKILFSSAQPWGGVEDDHKPFIHHRPNIPILHLISTPFPRVWHTMNDNEKAINYDVTDNFNRIFRVFVANYMRLPAVACGKGK